MRPRLPQERPILATGQRRAALYARVSTKKDEQATALAASQERLREYARLRGFSAVEFSDRLSGAKCDRPDYVAMLEAARRREVDVVVVTKLDRLARSVEELYRVANELRVLGVDLVALDQGVDTTTPAGRALFGMIAVFAEFERDLTRDRVLRGVETARARGVRFGRKPVNADLEELARAMRAGGASLGTIAAHFAGAGRPVTRSWVSRCCRKPDGVRVAAPEGALTTSARCPIPSTPATGRTPS